MFKNQPKGLLAAALANMGERFGFYIMMAILTPFTSAKFGLPEPCPFSTPDPAAVKALIHLCGALSPTTKNKTHSSS